MKAEEGAEDAAAAGEAADGAEPVAEAAEPAAEAAEPAAEAAEPAAENPVDAEAAPVTEVQAEPRGLSDTEAALGAAAVLAEDATDEASPPAEPESGV